VASKKGYNEEELETLDKHALMEAWADLMLTEKDQLRDTSE